MLGPFVEPAITCTRHRGDLKRDPKKSETTPAQFGHNTSPIRTQHRTCQHTNHRAAMGMKTTRHGTAVTAPVEAGKEQSIKTMSK